MKRVFLTVKNKAIHGKKTLCQSSKNGTNKRYDYLKNCFSLYITFFSKEMQ